MYFIPITECAAATIEFAPSEFSVFENESQLIVTLHLSAPAAYSFEVFIVAIAQSAGGIVCLLALIMSLQRSTFTQAMIFHRQIMM